MTAIAYDKGYFFLRLLEQIVGREAFDDFLSAYFSKHAFQVMDTDQFLSYLNENLLTTEALRNEVNVSSWVDGEGLPSNCPEVFSSRIDRVDEMVANWTNGTISSSELPWTDWTYQEKYRFLSNLSDDLDAERMAELDDTWNINQTGNNEVFVCLVGTSHSLSSHSIISKVAVFLVEIGRRKFLTPLYSALIETNQKDLAASIYGEARGNYHSVATGTMDALLEWHE